MLSSSNVVFPQSPSFEQELSTTGYQPKYTAAVNNPPKNSLLRYRFRERLTISVTGLDLAGLSI